MSKARPTAAERSRANPADAPRAVLFDAYGTLFDVYSVGLLAEQLFPGHGQGLSLLWRDKQIEYTRLVTTSNHGAHYQPFWALTRAALVYALKRIVAPTQPAGTDFEPQIERLVDPAIDVRERDLEPVGRRAESHRALDAAGRAGWEAPRRASRAPRSPRRARRRAPHRSAAASPLERSDDDEPSP